MKPVAAIALVFLLGAVVLASCESEGSVETQPDVVVQADVAAGVDVAASEDVGTATGAPLGSCDSQGLSHQCSEYYANEEGAAASAAQAEQTCTIIQNTWHPDTSCSTDGLLATCRQDIGGAYETVTIAYYYDEAGTATGQAICEGSGGTWTAF